MLAYLFVLFAVAVRLLPHPMAFTPVAGALLPIGMFFMLALVLLYRASRGL